MKITEQEVRYVADLANLRLSDEEVRRFQADLDEILVYIDKLGELDTAEVQPMAQVLFDQEETATLRPDTEHVPLGSDAALANTPYKGAGHFKVPRVIAR